MKKSSILKLGVACSLMMTPVLFASESVTEVYNKDGIVVNLKGDEKGKFKVSVKNQSKKDMFGVKIVSEEIKGLKLIKGKELVLGDIKAGEEKVLEEKEIQYEIAKAIESQKLVKTSISGVYKLYIPLTIAGLTGMIYLLVSNRKKSKKLMSMILATGMIGASFIGVTNAKESYSRKETLEGKVVVEGKEYNYVGLMMWNEEKMKDDSQNPQDDTIKPEEPEKPVIPNKPNEPSKPDEKPVVPDKPDEVEQDFKTLDIRVEKENSPLKSSPARLMKWDGLIPIVVTNLESDENGKINLPELEKNSKYELWMQNKAFKFDKDVVKFETGEDGNIVIVDEHNVENYDDLKVTFNAYEKNSENLTVTEVNFKVIYKDTGEPAKDVEFTANTLQPKLASYKNFKSDENGNVKFKLEGAVGGKIYTICVSKNAQFYYKFEPEEITITIDENGKVVFKDNIEPIFKVEKEDKSYLRKNLEKKILEAEEIVKKSLPSEKIEELKKIIDSAKKELAKPETIPQYVEGFYNQLDELIKEVQKPIEEKFTIPMIMVMFENLAHMEKTTFEVVNVENSEIKEVTSDMSMLTNIEVIKGKEYILRVKENDKYTSEEIHFIVGEDNEPKIKGKDEVLSQIELKKKTEKKVNLELRGNKISADVLADAKSGSLKTGTDVNIKLTPDEKYYPEYFIVNGVDLVKELKETKLTDVPHHYSFEYSFKIEDNTEIRVGYEKLSELEFKGEGLKLVSPKSFRMEKGTPYVVVITPPEGKTISKFELTYEDKQIGSVVTKSFLGQVNGNKFESYLDTCTLIEVEYDNIKETPESMIPFDASTGTILEVGYNFPKDAIIPEKINGVTVKHISDYAFSYKGLNSIKLPNTIETIGENAFDGNSLKEIKLPKNLVTIKEQAFMGNKIENLDIPTTVTEIGSGAFAKNKISKLVLPDTVEKLGAGAFMYNELEEFSIPKGLTEIPRRLFEGNKLKSVTIPSEITKINEKAFYSNEIQEVSIPESLKLIDNLAFAKNKLTSVNIPNSETKVSPTAFDSSVKTNLENSGKVETASENDFLFEESTGTITSYLGQDFIVKIPETIRGTKVTRIEGSWQGVFEGANVYKVIVPEGVNFIGKKSFKDCGATEIVLPDTVTEISESAFENNNLTSINLKNVTKIGANAFKNNKFIGNIDLSKVTEMGNGAFADNKFTTVNLSNDLKEIPNESFKNNSLTAINIPENITRIGDSAFAGNRITELEIPSKVVEIGNLAFSGNGIKNLVVPKNVTLLGKSTFAFNGMQTLEVNGATEILNKAFYGNEISTLKLSDEVVLKEGEIFQFNKLTEVKIPRATKKLPHLVFAKNKISNVIFHDELEEIGYGSLYVNRLTDVKIPDSVKVIGNAAFFNNSISSLKLPNNIEVIEDGTFQLNNLTEVIIPDSVKIIKKGAFAENKIKEITISNTVDNQQGFDETVIINKK